MNSSVDVQGIQVDNDKLFNLFGGINVLKGRDHAIRTCEQYVKVNQKLVIPDAFKASFDKANHS